MKRFCLLYGLLFTTAIGRGVMPETIADEICLNGDQWTFQPEKLPFYGYELDAPGRWLPSQRSHQFIVDAISDPTNDWKHPRPVRVPMAWSSATSDPGTRAASGDFDFPSFWQYVHRGVYEREFSVPSSFHDRRIKLWFESVNFRCWVYVNGTLVPGGETTDVTHDNKHPFEIDITDLVLAPSEHNRIRVVVQDFTAALAGPFPNEDHPKTGIDYPVGDRCDYYNKDRGWRNIDSGLIGDVMLRAVPLVNVADVFIRTSVQHAAIKADLTLRNEDKVAHTFRVVAGVNEWKSGKASLSFDDTPLVTLAPREVKTITLRQSWAEPRLWWPHDPFLYLLNVDLETGERSVRVKTERFGFREVEMKVSEDVDQRGFYLNGVRTRLFGESVEPTWKDGYTEGVGTSGLYLYNPEYWSALIDEAKRLNMTVLRLHRGMWIKRMLEIADEKGLMLMAESTLNNGNHKGGDGTVANQRRAIGDMIVALRNHPSVVIWALANESPFQEEWADEAKLRDQTRPYVATQTVPRNHPSPSLAAASGSYAMGLFGYEPNIYHRHDAAWSRKPIYIYEDNAGYDQPGDRERVTAVQKGLTLFRGHRSSGYEIICTFYTWQKLYGQPQNPDEKYAALYWSSEEINARGYHPDFARMSLLDPWTDRSHLRIRHPLNDYPDPPEEFWQRSFSPVAVFDRNYDQRSDIAINPYIAPLETTRLLTVHNDDLIDFTTAIRVTWTVSAFDADKVISTGEFEIEVPLGGIRGQSIQLDAGANEAVRVTFRAFKSGQERFHETIYLRGHNTVETPAASIPQNVAGEIIQMNAVDPGVESEGYHRETIAGQVGPAVLVADSVTDSDYVQFNPLVTVEGDYDVYLHVPPGLQGTQSVEIRHDTLNTTVSVDLSAGGWIRLTVTPLTMSAGALQNVIRIGKTDTSIRSVVDALKLVRVK